MITPCSDLKGTITSYQHEFHCPRKQSDQDSHAKKTETEKNVTGIIESTVKKNSEGTAKRTIEIGQEAKELNNLRERAANYNNLSANQKLDLHRDLATWLNNHGNLSPLSRELTNKVLSGTTVINKNALKQSDNELRNFEDKTDVGDKKWESRINSVNQKAAQYLEEYQQQYAALYRRAQLELKVQEQQQQQQQQPADDETAAAINSILTAILNGLGAGAGTSASTYQPPMNSGQTFNYGSNPAPPPSYKPPPPVQNPSFGHGSVGFTPSAGQGSCGGPQVPGGACR